MSNLFTILRGCLLGSIAAWTLIVLGIAIHFQMSFVDSSSELTYVSLAVFVAAVTLALFSLLLVAPCNKKIANLSRTKWELTWLGILSVLWLSLAGYTTTPHAKDTEVECWDEDDETGAIIDDNVEGYSNDVYHARYRVLQAFTFFNAILLLLLFLFILLLALWHHKRGRYVIWTTPTTSVGWFDRGTMGQYRRPILPVTTRRKEDKYEELKEDKMYDSKKPKWTEFDDWDEKPKDKFKEKSDTVQKPPAVARAITTAQISKPKQYVVQVPITEMAKPALAPIAAKMTAGRDTEDPSRSKPVRQPSQRELADAARQQARRERTAEEDLSRQPSRKRAVEEDLSRRPSRRQAAEEDLSRRPSRKERETTNKPSTPEKDDNFTTKPTTTAPVRKPVPRDAFKDSRTTNASTSKPAAAPPAVTRPDPRRNENKSTGATTTRPPAAVTRPTTEEKRQPAQPAIVRSGSGNSGTARPSKPRDTTDNARPSLARQASQQQQSRTPGRRI